MCSGFRSHENSCRNHSRIHYLIGVEDITVLPGRAPVGVSQEWDIVHHFQKADAHNRRPVNTNSVRHETAVGNTQGSRVEDCSSRKLCRRCRMQTLLDTEMYRNRAGMVQMWGFICTTNGPIINQDTTGVFIGERTVFSGAANCFIKTLTTIQPPFFSNDGMTSSLLLSGRVQT